MGWDDFFEQCNPKNIPMATKTIMLVAGILDLFFFGVFFHSFIPLPSSLFHHFIS